MRLRNVLPVTTRRYLKPYGELLQTSLPRQRGPHVRFIIYGQGRTGSTLLQKLLNQHPQVSCLGEPLNQRGQRKLISAEKKLTSWERAARQAGNDVFGCHIKSYQLETVYGREPSSFVRRRAADGWSIIHLERADTVRQCISALVAEQRGLYHAPISTDQTQLEAVDIDPEMLVSLCHRRAALLSDERELAEQLGLLRLRYEDDLRSATKHQATARACFRYLGIDEVPVTAPIARTSSTQLKDQVRNLDDVLKALDAAGLKAQSAS